MRPSGIESRPPLIAVAFASGVALAYQILLLRLFSIVQFHHTAYMVISLALLGYGASGSVLTLWRRRWMTRFDAAFGTCLTLFGVTAITCFTLAQRIAVHPEELLWNPRQLAWLLALYLLLAVPFFFVGTALGMALMRFPTARVYAADLVGAGTGALLVVGLLWLLTPGDVLRLLAMAAVVTGATRVHPGGILVTVAFIWAMPGPWVEPQPSEYKGLSQALRVHGTRLVAERSNPLALVSVVESPQVPLRHAPGLSLAVPSEPAEQVGLFLDAEALVPIVRWQAGSDRLAYLEYSTSALPYALTDPKRVLVLGAGGGEEVARARYFGVESLVGVEINPDVVDLVRGDYADFSGHLYSRPGVDIRIQDIRGFAASDPHPFDLVILATVSGYGGGGPALASLSEDYLLTVEAFDAYLDLVAPGGLLAATVFLENPPRDAVKLTATAIAALERRGVRNPGNDLAMIRGWQTATLVVKRGALDEQEIVRLRDFSNRRLFDTVYRPGMLPLDANRHNRLPAVQEGTMPHQLVSQLLGPEREAFFSRYKFAVRPATDNRPFFHQFFRWRSLPEITESRGRGGLSLLEAGYLVLIATLALAIVSALVLVVTPLATLRGNSPTRLRLRVVLYFGALGLGFLLLEVAFLQQLILVLHHPVYSAAVVIASFLVFAGLGSAVAPALEARLRQRTVAVVGGVIIAVGLIDLGILALFSSAVAGRSTLAQIAFAVSVVAPLAFLMGMPFPIGLNALKSSTEELVPWAWAINGSASVVSPILATLVAVHWGFRAVVLLALVAYALAAAAHLGEPAAEASP